ncbi:UPF0758 protein [Trichinella pseudospiralis]
MFSTRQHAKNCRSDIWFPINCDFQQQQHNKHKRLNCRPTTLPTIDANSRVLFVLTGAAFASVLKQKHGIINFPTALRNLSVTKRSHFCIAHVCISIDHTDNTGVYRFR